MHSSAEATGAQAYSTGAQVHSWVMMVEPLDSFSFLLQLLNSCERNAVTN